MVKTIIYNFMVSAAVSVLAISPRFLGGAGASIPEATTAINLNGKAKTTVSNLPAPVRRVYSTSKDTSNDPHLFALTDNASPKTKLGIYPKRAIAIPRTKIPSLDVKINELAECESRGNARAKYLDSDGYYSYGALQFHKNTLRIFSSKYGFRDTITEEDLYNSNLQKSVAKAMLTDNPKLWRQWWNCARITGLDKWIADNVK